MSCLSHLSSRLNRSEGLGWLGLPTPHACPILTGTDRGTRKMLLAIAYFGIDSLPQWKEFLRLYFLGKGISDIYPHCLWEQRFLPTSCAHSGQQAGRAVREGRGPCPQETLRKRNDAGELSP